MNDARYTIYILNITMNKNSSDKLVAKLVKIFLP